MSELKEKTAKGLLWGGFGYGMMQVLNLVFGIFLSRLLSPSDYGIVGALTIFSALAVIFSESGFLLAIVNKKSISRIDYDSVFWFNVAMSLTLYSVLWFCAPLIARFYSQPEMVPLSRFIFIGFVASALSSTPSAYFFRNLDVKTRTKSQLIALGLSGVAGVTAAFAGMGYWAIAIQTVTYTGFNSLLLWVQCPWRPRFSFSFPALKEMLPFSLKQLAVSVFTQFNNNIFSVLLGRFYGMKITGYYTQGNKWTSMGTVTISGMLLGVGQPVLRQTIDDRERLHRVFRQLLRFTCLVSFPAMFGLDIVSREFIVILITDKWLDSVSVMQILCIGGAFLPLSTLYGNLFNSIGRPGIYMWNTIILGGLQTLSLCLTYQFGLTTMLIVYTIINILWVGVWQIMARRETGLKTRLVIADIVPYLLMAGIVMGGVAIITAPTESLWLKLATKVILGGGLYIVAVRIFRPEDFKEAIDFIRHRN